MKRVLLLLAALALQTANAQTLTTTAATTPTPSQVLALAPQLLAFAGSDANFAALVNGLALGAPVTLTTPLATGGSQTFTFTPAGTMGVLDIAQTLEKVRQLLISRGVATPTAAQLGTALTGGSLTTASGTAAVSPVVTSTTTASTQSPANAIQNANSTGNATNAAAGSTTPRNMSDSALPRGIADTPALPVAGVTAAPAPSAVTTEAARLPNTPAPAVRGGDR